MQQSATNVMKNKTVMVYVIPRGTPIAIARYGCSLRPHVAKRDLAFSAPLTASGDELTFHDGYWQIVVDRSMVVSSEMPAGSAPSAW